MEILGVSRKYVYQVRHRVETCVCVCMFNQAQQHSSTADKHDQKQAIYRTCGRIHMSSCCTQSGTGKYHTTSTTHKHKTQGTYEVNSFFFVDRTEGPEGINSIRNRYKSTLTQQPYVCVYHTSTLRMVDAVHRTDHPADHPADHRARADHRFPLRVNTRSRYFKGRSIHDPV